MNAIFHIPQLTKFILVFGLVLLLACVVGNGTGGNEPGDSESGGTPSSLVTPESTTQRSILRGQEPTPTPAPTTGDSSSVAPVLEEGSATVRPEGYYLGNNHGLALAQTARRPSEVRDGWMDITLNLVGVRFAGGRLQVQDSEGASVFCFEDTQDGPEPSDCLSVKWGSTNQNEAQLKVTGMESSNSHKAVNFQATFEVAANATKGSLFFGEHEIALDLQGNYVRRPKHFPSLLAPEPPSSGDAKTAGYFVGSENGIRVARVSRTSHRTDSLISTSRVDLWILPLGDNEVPELGDSTGSTCLGANGTDCIEIFWGPEKQFNAVLSLNEGEVETFATARRAGARWPLPISVRFITPNIHDNAVLRFGGHEIALDLRGMAGQPTFDYAAHYSEATPGSVLYDSGGKTVVLDSLSHNSDDGSMELSMTASNGSEAEDFGPVIIPDGVFSTRGMVDVNEGQRTFLAEKLAPGQSTSFAYSVPRGGDGNWGYVAYSEDSARRPDGLVIRVADSYAPDGTPKVDGGGFVSVADSTNFVHDPQTSFPAFAKFQRRADEGKFWPVKMLWRHPVGYSDSGDFHIVPEGIAYAASQNYSLDALDAVTGEQIWDFAPGPFENFAPGFLRFDVVDEVVYAQSPNHTLLYALNAATGEQIWDSVVEHGFSYVYFSNGIVFAHTWNTLQALNAGTGEQVWDFAYPWGQISVNVADGVVYMGVSHSGEFFALNALTGEEIWETPADLDGDFWGIEVADGVAYVNSEGTLYALNAATGERLWRHGGWPSPAARDFIVADGTVYVKYSGRTDNIVALGAPDGEPIWESPGRLTRVAGGKVYGEILNESAEFVLFALDARTGEKIWEIESGGSVVDLYEMDGTVYMSSYEGEHIQGLDAHTGKLIWQAGIRRQVSHVTAVGGVVYAQSAPDSDGLAYVYALLAEKP